MRATVITAVRNAEKEICATLKSVASQQDIEIEHIVIDGASTDETLRNIDRFGRHVSMVVSEPDAGIYDAFNKGLARASGEFVGFLNAGDMD